MQNLRLLVMIEVAFFAAFAFILDILPSIKISPAISISFAMVPIFILAFRRGVVAGLLSGFLWGLLQVVFGDAVYVTPVQFMIEYFIAFAFVGFGGLFYTVIQKSFQNGHKKAALAWIVLATLVGSLARYFWHFIAGVVFWGKYAPDGMSPVIYSLVANGTTMLGAFVLCSVILVAVLASAPRIIMENSSSRNKSEKVS
ncbi:energy-coupled thiamine transporter ThiT [Cerasibacillus sp. JNUCC 74]|jgi:thiamine transporter|uniref:energy-coupled thiamine transporter ThiT n=1 Tax=Virgibacillus proomii TaxID=84407 RepID=UPI0009840EF7|nr:energy-coupled thiamine transporter ThiT [Virgibacillus proomii]